MAIIIKNSSTPSKVPLSGDLVLGELAINTADSILYAKNVGGSVVAVGGGGGGSDPTKVLKTGDNMTGALGLISDSGGNTSAEFKYDNGVTTASYGLIYSDNTSDFNIEALTTANMNIKSGGATRVTVDASTGDVSFASSWSCGDIVATDADSTLVGFSAKDYGETVVTTTGVSGTHDVNISNGNVHQVTMTGATTFTFTSTHTNYSFNMILNGTKTITWPAGIAWPNSTVPTFTDGGTDMVVFQVIDTTIIGSAILNIG